LGDRLIVRYYSRVYVYGFNTRTWSEWTSARDVLKYFGPIVTINDPNGDIYYAGSSITAYRGLIRLFDVQDATNKEQAFTPTYTILDTFTRTASNGWSSADTGQAWTIGSGMTASDFSVNATDGLISHGTRSVNRFIEMLTPVLSDFDLTIDVAVDKLAVTASMFTDITVRNSVGSNNYLIRFEWVAAGANTRIQLYKVVAGVGTNFADISLATAYAANDKFTIRIRCQGTQIRVKAWKTGAQEPNGWTITQIDATFASGWISCSSLIGGTNTTTLPVLFKYDNLQIGPLTGQVEDITCVAKTKNFDMAVSNQFKRLWWWGADVATNRDITGTATPIVISFDTIWSSLSSTPWNQLKTWAQPLTEPTGVTTMVTTGAGTARRFVKFLKALRYRQINFSVTMKTQGSTVDGPAKLFTEMIITETKEGVVKAIS
jgi:hypothetical protein